MVEVFYSLGTVVAPVGLAGLIGRGSPGGGLYAVIMVGSLVVAVALGCMHPQRKVALHQAEQEPVGKFRLNLTAWWLIAFAMLYNFVEPGFTTFASTYFTEAVGDDLGSQHFHFADWVDDGGQPYDFQSLAWGQGKTDIKRCIGRRNGRAADGIAAV